MFITTAELRDYVNATAMPEPQAERIAATADGMVCGMLDPTLLQGRVPAEIRTATLVIAGAIWRQEQTGSGTWQVDDMSYPSPQALTSGILRRYAALYVAYMNVGSWVG